MNVENILKELHSDGMKEIVKTVSEIMKRVESQSIELKQAHIEMVGCKHILQSFALSMERESFLQQTKKLSATPQKGKR